ncbi:MAG: outer membrane protein assembly factor [Bryobacterales bacterium]|nr:outer membrane protein assembly factor [Bryobacterales bacterium]
MTIMITTVRALSLGNVRLRMLVALFAGLSPAFGQDTPTARWEGRPISRIEFDPPQQPLTLEELNRLLPFKEGSSLTMAEVRQAIQKLYSTGRYSDVSIDASQIDTGQDGTSVALRISTQLNYFISGVNVAGENEPPNRNQLITASKLELGALFVESDLDQAVANMQEKLRANGLYNATIQNRVDRRPETEEANVYFELDPKTRAHFDGAELAGDINRPKESVLRATGWHRGLGPIWLPGWWEVTENRVQTGLERLRKDFQKGDRLEAKVTLDKLDYHSPSNTVTPYLTIDSGPIVEVRTTGTKLSASRLRELVPIYQERSVDRSLLVEGQRNLVEYLRSQGYFDAQVDFTWNDPEPSRSLIEYDIMRGDRHKLKRIEITGNRYFDAATLRERMYLQPASLLRRRYGRYSERLLQQDEQNIADLYRANGFSDVMVTHKVEDDYGGERGSLVVEIQVNEGPQWLVNQLVIEGIPMEEAEYLRSTLRSTEGQPYSAANIAADRDTVLGYYYNNGYPDAQFESSQDPAPVQNRVNLRYVVALGVRQYVRGTLVRGLETTNPPLVASRISLAPGDPISQSRIAQSQQRLYDLGIFSKVQTALQNPEGKEERKYVLFHLDEARKYSFNFGVGAEIARIGGGTTSLDYPAGTTGFSPRLSVGVSRINFMGLGHTVSLQTVASTLRRRALFNYVAPQFKGHESLALTFSALFDDSRDVRTFSARRWEGSVQLAQKVSRANTLQYRYTFRRVTLDPNSLKITPQLIPLLSQPVRVGLIGGSFIQDRRDDPVNSHRGMLNTVDLAYAWKGFASETDFTRLLLRNATYHPLGREIVIARSLQVGYIQRWGGLPDIPLSERFFSGGASTHRAFPDNQAGPRDLITGFPIGGKALLFHSTELRFPLIGDNIGGVLFHDMGNVYSDVTSISFRFHQRNLQDFDYMVHGIGFGIRVRTPVGPIRGDFSFSPNAPRFFGFNGTRDDLLKVPPTQPLCSLQTPSPMCSNQRISWFQFHFSLGQTF